MHGLIAFSLIFIYTWKKSGHRLWQRLDRLLCNNEWQSLFGDCQVSHLNRENSDHSPLLGQFGNQCREGGCFSFQQMWLTHDSFMEIVKISWADRCLGNPFFIFSEKLKRLKKTLISWNKNHFGNIFQNIRQAENVVVDAEMRCEMDDSVMALENLNVVRGKLNHLLQQEEVFWKQRAKVKWIQEGDRNTNFFHAYANQKRKKGRIYRIQADEGIWLDNQKDILKAGVEFFQNLFTGENTVVDFQLIGEYIPRVSLRKR